MTTQSVIQDMNTGGNNGSQTDEMGPNRDTWTQWYNVDNPKNSSSNGDYETLDKIQSLFEVCSKGYEVFSAQCRKTDTPDVIFDQDRPKIGNSEVLFRYCTKGGLICRNEDQVGRECSDYSIRFRCHYKSESNNNNDSFFPQFDVRIYIVLAVVPVLIFVARILWAYVCRRRRRHRRNQRRSRHGLNRINSNGDYIDDDSSSIASGVANPPPSYQDLFGKTGYVSTGSSVFAISRENIPICSKCKAEPCSVALIIDKQRTSENPESNIQAVATENPDSNIQDVATENPDSNIQPVAIENPDSNIQAVATENPDSNIQPVATENPGSNIQPVATENPDSNIQPVATENLGSNIQPVATENPDSNIQPVATENPDSNIQPVATENPDSNIQPVATENLDSNIQAVAIENPDSGLQTVVAENPDSNEQSESPNSTIQTRATGNFDSNVQTVTSDPDHVLPGGEPKQMSQPDGSRAAPETVISSVNDNDSAVPEQATSQEELNVAINSEEATKEYNENCLNNSFSHVSTLDTDRNHDVNYLHNMNDNFDEYAMGNNTLGDSQASASSITNATQSDMTVTLSPSLLHPPDISQPCACPCHRTIPLKYEGASGYDNQGFAVEGDDAEVNARPTFPGMHIPIIGMHRAWSELSTSSTVTQSELPTYELALELMNKKKKKEAEAKQNLN